MSTNDQLSFGDVLRHYRVAAGLTQEALAERARLSARGVQDLERGVRLAPYAETVRRLAEALSLPETERTILQSAARRPSSNPSGVATRAARGLPTGMVTFLFTDVEGSTRLWQQYRAAMGLALARHDELIETLVAHHNGTLVRPRGEGDSRFAVFARASDAVAAACVIQVALVREAWALPEPLRVRMAIHTGEGELRLGDYYGPAVNHCARLRATAHGGQVLVSTVTADLVREALATRVTLRDVGEHQLEDLERPERIWQVVHPELPAEGAPLLRVSSSHDNLPGQLSQMAAANDRVGAKARDNLPVQLTSFIGRVQEVTGIRRQLRRTHLLTLTGAGGIGKTRLALRVVADLVDAYADGVWLVELAALTDQALVPQTVAATLATREEPGRPVTQALAGGLRAKHVLLVLDNCEHVIEACARLAAELLRSCPKLTILATSREPLGAEGEATWPVPPLSAPNPHQLPSIESLAEYDAVRLFVDRAGVAQASFTVNTQNAAAVAQACSQLDGIPLAIELAAARVKFLNVAQIVERLDDRFRLLTRGSRTAPARHQTLRAAFDWSYDLLTDSEKVLFQRLGVFVGGWTLEAAEAVCSGGSLQTHGVLEALGNLVDKSLVVVNAADAAPRYRLLETLRQYALEWLTQSGEVDIVHRRHTDFFLALAEEADPHLRRGPRTAEWLLRLERDRENLRAALSWCVEHGDLDRGLRFGGAVWSFWVWEGSFSEGRECLTALLRLAEGAPAARTVTRARVLNGAGHLADMLGDHATAQALLEEHLAILRELGRPVGAAIGRLGRVAWRRGEYARARTLLEESLATARAAGDRAAEAVQLRFLGQLFEEQQDYAAARRLNAESLAIYRDLGDKVGMADVLSGQGCVALAQGDVAAAAGLCEDSLTLAREMEDPYSIAWGCLHLALVRVQQGDWAAARALFEENLCFRGYLQDQRRIPRSLAGLASVAAASGNPERALRLFGAADAQRDAVRRPPTAWLDPPFDRASVERWEPDARAALGEQAATAVYSAGRSLSLDEAIAEALAGDPPREPGARAPSDRW